MQEVMRIGDQFVMADDDVKDISHTGTDITDAAQKYKTDVLAVISKGDKHQLVAQHHERDTLLYEDIGRIIALIHATADIYNMDAIELMDAIKWAMDELEKGE